jgi:hypothetical protein
MKASAFDRVFDDGESVIEHLDQASARRAHLEGHPGSDFDDFLKEEGIYEEVTARAQKRLLALQLADAMKQSNLTKVQLARRLGTSRSQLDRLLDPDNTAITLESMQRLAEAVGRQLRLELVSDLRP